MNLRPTSTRALSVSARRALIKATDNFGPAWVQSKTGISPRVIAAPCLHIGHAEAAQIEQALGADEDEGQQ